MNRELENDLIIYKAESSIRKPARLISELLKNLFQSKDLAWRIFVRDISAQYRQSLLGIFWAFFPPIVTSLIFILLQSRNIISISETSIPYPVYVLIGTTLWQIFTDSLNAPLRATIAAKPFLVKIYFPHEALILSAFYLVVFNTLIRATIIIAVFVYFGIQPTWAILMTPLAILVLILIGMCLGLFLTPIGMLYSDISTSLPIFTQLLFFATPVVYNIPDRFPFSILNVINPVSPILTGIRDLMTVGYINNLNNFLIVAFVFLIASFIALIIYRVSLPIIIEKIGS